jgi:dTDP-4-amino-4,6-dideoxygalactose transaminase
MADVLKAAGIQTSIHYPPIHWFSAFRASGRHDDLPKTEEFASRELTLPLYPSLGVEKVDEIATAILDGLPVSSM